MEEKEKRTLLVIWFIHTQQRRS